VRLAQTLTRQAVQTGREALVATNLPGQGKLYVDLSGSVKDSRARLYAAWLGVVGAKAPLSRKVLKALWGRATKTLLGYEDVAGVGVRANFAQYHDPCAPCVPAHAFLCQDDHRRAFVSWRLPNTYSFTSVSPARKGNARKARKAALAAYTDTPRPVEKMGDGMQRVGRLYFADEANAAEPAFKQIDRHLQTRRRARPDAITPRLISLRRCSCRVQRRSRLRVKRSLKTERAAFDGSGCCMDWPGRCAVIEILPLSKKGNGLIG
jgi:hypothetical protein